MWVLIFYYLLNNLSGLLALHRPTIKSTHVQIITSKNNHAPITPNKPAGFGMLLYAQKPAIARQIILPKNKASIVNAWVKRSA